MKTVESAEMEACPMGITGLDIRDEQINDVTVIALRGRLDFGTAKDFLEHFKNRITNHQKRIVLDMDALEFIDSAGVGMLLTAYRLLDGQGGTLKICAVQHRVKSVFALTRVAEFFVFLKDRKAALKAMGQAV